LPVQTTKTDYRQTYTHGTLEKLALAIRVRLCPHDARLHLRKALSPKLYSESYLRLFQICDVDSDHIHRNSSGWLGSPTANDDRSTVGGSLDILKLKQRLVMNTSPWIPFVQ
jgi:hypothetical protein